MGLGERNGFDVVVVGAGTAGLSASLVAYEHETRVLVLEKAPRAARGGNGRFTGGALRFTHHGIKELREFLTDLPQSLIDSLDIPEYSPDDFYGDLMRVSEGLADPILCELVVKESNLVMRWLNQLGVKWDINYDLAARVDNRLKFLDGGVSLSSTGGGQGLLEMMLDIAERKGIEIRYETKAVKLLMDTSGRVCGVRVRGKEGFRDIRSGSVILASGGFEANPEMRTKYLGSNCSIVKVRGTRYNTGDGLKMALEIGAQPTGHWSGYHATMVDLDAPDVEGGPETACKSYLFGVVVNADGQRFVDEGEDFYAYTYAKIGRITLTQPRGIAFQIFDTKTIPLLRSEYDKVTPVQADSIEELAQELGIGPVNLRKTVKEFNEAVQDGKFDPAILDGKRTEGISPPKSNWAQKIDTPPFRAYPVTTGLTFTFGGIKSNKEARVFDTEGNPIPGLYAAGVIVGGFFYHNYCGGSGITMGLVFGRIAGANAAMSARKRWPDQNCSLL